MRLTCVVLAFLMLGFASPQAGDKKLQKEIAQAAKKLTIVAPKHGDWMGIAVNPPELVTMEHGAVVRVGVISRWLQPSNDKVEVVAQLSEKSAKPAVRCVTRKKEVLSKGHAEGRINVTFINLDLGVGATGFKAKINVAGGQQQFYIAVASRQIGDRILLFEGTWPLEGDNANTEFFSSVVMSSGKRSK